MSILELCETVRTRGQLLEAWRICMRKNRTSVVSCSASRPVLGVIERDGTIDGDRVMQRLQERANLRGAASKIPGPMHWLSWMMSKSPRRPLQDLLDAQRIRERLAEARRFIMTPNSRKVSEGR